MPTAGGLAEEIAAVENDYPKSQVTAQQPKRVYISLIQIRFGTLDRAGVIHYHTPTKAVTGTTATEPVADYSRDLTAMCHP